MNATMAAVLADAGPPPPTGGNFLPLVHYGGWAMFFVCLLGFVVAAAWLAWRQRRVEVPEKFIGLVLLGTVLGGTVGAVLGSVSRMTAPLAGAVGILFGLVI